MSMNRQRFQLETLESRVLLSGDVAAVVAEASGMEAPLEISAEVNLFEQPSTPEENLGIFDGLTTEELISEGSLQAFSTPTLNPAVGSEMIGPVEQTFDSTTNTSDET